MMDTNFTDTKALTSIVITITTALVGLLVTLGIDISNSTQTSLVAFITVITPVVLAVIGWLRHSHAKVQAAALSANPQLAAVFLGHPTGVHAGAAKAPSAHPRE